MSVSDFPHLNAALNALAATLLVMGWIFIRNEQVKAHRNCMLMAIAVSAAFLTCYLIYHFHAGSVKFPAYGFIRYVYFSILLTHTVLAAAVPFLVGITVYHAARGQFPKHKRIARWTLPIWLYVSVTGVVVYLMLYQMYDVSS
ncbi:MAG: DUF420 domain-containing protein [Phycisphaerales bacterium]|nr:DUF420 domain-containing protein [Phycisphaerales bacterium]MCB9854277.1 DUF420 domain-containing protein [Phycisphaerales bacterium]